MVLVLHVSCVVQSSFCSRPISVSIPPASIAVDWINKKVYYNDGNDIGVYHIGSGTNEHLLTTEQLARPLSLAVDPING